MKDYNNKKQRFIIYRNGSDLKTYWDIKKDLTPESLDESVSMATGVSGGSAITVPAMLLPNDITWIRPIRFNKPERIDDEVLDNIDCFRIQDSIAGGNVILWIDKENFLLRKIYREKQFDDFLSQETTIYRPRLNGEVTNEMLEFNSPEEKNWWKFW